MTVVVIAARGGVGAKSRLARVLDPLQREGLTLAMLGAMLRRLGPGRCRVVSPTPSLLTLAHGLGAEPIRQRSGGLNAAFDLGRAASRGLTVLLPGDLPLIQASDLEAVAAASADCELVLSPATVDGGTACVALDARAPYRPLFGPDSFLRHRRQALAMGLPHVLIRRAGLGQDIDRPAELAHLDSLAAVDPHFAAFWRSIVRSPRPEAV